MSRYFTFLFFIYNFIIIVVIIKFCFKTTEDSCYFVLVAALFYIKISAACAVMK